MAVNTCHTMIEWTLPRSHAPFGITFVAAVLESITSIARPRIAPKRCHSTFAMGPP